MRKILRLYLEIILKRLSYCMIVIVFEFLPFNKIINNLPFSGETSKDCFWRNWSCYPRKRKEEENKIEIKEENKEGCCASQTSKSFEEVEKETTKSSTTTTARRPERSAATPSSRLPISRKRPADNQTGRRTSVEFSISTTITCFTFTTTTTTTTTKRNSYFQRHLWKTTPSYY